MDADMSPEMALQVLDMLTGGGSMDNINTSLALRLIPLAQELDDHDLVERLLEHASTIAASDEERGWARFEALKVMDAEVDTYLRLAEDAETKSVSKLKLLEVIPKHGGFVGDVTVLVRCLGDGEEDVMLHAQSPLLPQRLGS